MILILHGWGQDKTFWENNTKQLSKLQKTQAIDLPGFGEEKLISPNWGVPEYADWVNNFISKNKLKNVILIGHSFGGRIASYLGSENPSWLKALILEATPAIYRPSQKTNYKIKFYKLSKSFMPYIIKNKFYSQELKDAGHKNLDIIFRKVVGFDQTKLLPKIKVPTLLVWGSGDKDVPIHIAKEINLLISNSKLVIIPDSSHQAHLENPNLFYGYVKKFIENL